MEENYYYCPYYIRGRTFDNSIIFLDGSQNLPPEVSSEILMRLGRSSRLIIAGDPILQNLLKLKKTVLLYLEKYY